MEMNFVWAFFTIMGIVFTAALVYCITYPKYEKHINLIIDLPGNSDCKIRNAISDFDINVEEEIQDVGLDKL